MKTLALDQSLNNTGWAVFSDKELTSHGVIKIQKDGVLQDRLLSLVQEVSQLIESEDIGKVVIEDIQMQIDKETQQKVYGEGNIVNVSTFKTLAQVQGALLALFADKEVPSDIYHSSAWKSSCGIVGAHRQEQKRSAQVYIEKKYGVKAIQDTVDAICLGEHAVNIGREKPKEKTVVKNEYAPISWD